MCLYKHTPGSAFSEEMEFPNDLPYVYINEII